LVNEACRFTTISASIITGKVVENDWGFRTNGKSPAPGVRFFRYTGEDKWEQ